VTGLQKNAAEGASMRGRLSATRRLRMVAATSPVSFNRDANSNP